MVDYLVNLLVFSLRRRNDKHFSSWNYGNSMQKLCSGWVPCFNSFVNLFYVIPYRKVLFSWFRRKPTNSSTIFIASDSRTQKLSAMWYLNILNCSKIGVKNCCIAFFIFSFCYEIHICLFQIWESQKKFRNIFTFHWTVYVFFSTFALLKNNITIQKIVFIDLRMEVREICIPFEISLKNFCSKEFFACLSRFFTFERCFSFNNF